MTIEKCYNNATSLTGQVTGGIVGTLATTGATLNIDQCIVHTDINNQAGGFIGRIESSISVTINITDCYLSGNVDGNGIMAQVRY